MSFNDQVAEQCQRNTHMSKQYKSGDKFICPETGECYILATTSQKMATLINLKDGNRWIDPIPIASHYGITEAEFNRMGGKSFNKIEILTTATYEERVETVTVNVREVKL